MKFESFQIKGRGRARTLGFPTINLQIPKGLKIKRGIYGANLIIDGKKYLGALHYGQSPTFDDTHESCEIYLIKVDDSQIPDTEGKKIEVELLKFIRGVKKFDSEDELVKRINEDVGEIINL